MKLTVLEVGKVPPSLQTQFDAYPRMFERMFAKVDSGFELETIPVLDGAPLPDPTRLQAIVVPGSPAGVYDSFEWIEELRGFIRAAYAARIPMLGICFGHQIMADALGGDVHKSEKGWGLGRHTYSVGSRPEFMASSPTALSVACSHQDQVITAPNEAEVILSSGFTPNAGLIYRNGAALSFQPHPEFEDDYSNALAELRRGQIDDAVVDTAIASFTTPSHHVDVAGYIAAFFKKAGG